MVRDEGHRRATGPVVEQLVDVERTHHAVRQGSRAGGRRPAGRPGPASTNPPSACTSTGRTSSPGWGCTWSSSYRASGSSTTTTSAPPPPPGCGAATTALRTVPPGIRHPAADPASGVSVAGCGPEPDHLTSPRSGKPAASAALAEATLSGACRYVGTAPPSRIRRAACATSLRARPRPRRGLLGADRELVPGRIVPLDPRPPRRTRRRRARPEPRLRTDAATAGTRGSSAGSQTPTSGRGPPARRSTGRPPAPRSPAGRAAEAGGRPRRASASRSPPRPRPRRPPRSRGRRRSRRSPAAVTTPITEATASVPARLGAAGVRHDVHAPLRRPRADPRAQVLDEPGGQLLAGGRGGGGQWSAPRPPAPPSTEELSTTAPADRAASSSSASRSRGRPAPSTSGVVSAAARTSRAVSPTGRRCSPAPSAADGSTAPTGRAHPRATAAAPARRARSPGRTRRSPR